MINNQTQKPFVRHAFQMRKMLMAGAALTTATGFASVAHAQESTDDSVETMNDSPVIIVQARRQDETLQEVPVTVTVIGGETLEKYNVDQVADVVSRVPTLNVQVGGSGSGGQLSLRGVGSSNISAAFDSAVAFDFDGVQVSTMRMVQAGFFDTQQIDILKGPQSLFFGKSASAGVFSIRSAEPTSTWEVGGKASYELEEKGWVFGGHISGPVTDTLGIRLAGQFTDIKDYVELQDGTPSVLFPSRGFSDFVGRATVAWEPTPGFDINLKAQYVHTETDGAIAHTDLFCGANGRADEVVLLQGAIAIPSGADCNAFDGKYFIPDASPAIAGSVPTATGPTLAEGGNGVPFGETDLFFARLLMNMEVSDNLTITTTTGYLNLDATDFDSYSYVGVGPAFNPGGVDVALIAPALAAVNGEGVPMGFGNSDPRNTLEQFSQEIRLTSDFDGPINFMTGAFYEWRNFGFDTSQQAINISITRPDPVTGFTYDWDKEQNTKTTAASFFGSAIIDLTDRLELSGGVRYTKEKKTARISVPYVHADLSAGPGFIDSGFLSGPIDFEDSNWSPEATIKYQASDDINVFASFKTGFKSGGIDNSALPSFSLLGFDDPDPAVRQTTADGLIYQSETAIGGEIGLKSQFSGRSVTFNVTGYYYVFDDLQVQNFDGGTVQFVTLNAGEVTTKGIDVSWGWDTPADGLSFSGNVAWLDATFSDTFVTTQGSDLDGRDVARAPNFSGNLAIDYEVPLGDAMALTFGGNAIYSGSYFTDEVTLNDFKQDSYVAFDAAVSIGDPDGAWKVSLIGVNLTDKIWVNTSGDRPFLALPGQGLPVGDDLVLTQNRGRQVFIETSFRF